MSSTMFPCCLEFVVMRKGRRKKTITEDLKKSNSNSLHSRRTSLMEAVDHYREMKARYDTSNIEFLGQGSFGSVYQVKCRRTGYSRAVKQISKKGMRRESLRSELLLLLELDHPHIIRLNNWFEDDYSVYLVTQLAPCGDLRSVSPLGASAEAARLFGQLMSAVRYIHGKGVAHRDLKGENCMLTGDAAMPTVKLIDFGVAMVHREDSCGRPFLNGRVGTVSHMAPEVRSGRKYGLECDIWSAGILLFLLITNVEPYPDGCHSRPTQDPQLPRHLAEPLVEVCVGAAARALLAAMLQWDPEARPDAHEVLQSEWLAGTQQEAKQMNHSSRRVLRRVRAWASTEATPMRQAVATAAAHTMEDEDVAEIRATFEAMDEGGQGCLTREEIREAFRKCCLHLTEEELASLFQALDREGLGRITWTDWLTAALEPDDLAKEQGLRAALNYLDLNGNGEVSPHELSRVLGASCAEAAFERWDADGDQRLTLDEVKAAMEGLAAQKAQLAQSPKIAQSPESGACDASRGALGGR